MKNEENGKKKVSKVGMAPVQSDGIEYEFSLVFDVAMNHEAEVSKDRTHLFSQNKIFKITPEVSDPDSGPEVYYKVLHLCRRAKIFRSLSSF